MSPPRRDSAPWWEDPELQAAMEGEALRIGGWQAEQILLVLRQGRRPTWAAVEELVSRGDERFLAPLADHLLDKIHLLVDELARDQEEGARDAGYLALLDGAVEIASHEAIRVIAERLADGQLVPAAAARASSLRHALRASAWSRPRKEGR